MAASATFSDVQIRDPAGNLLVAPNSFTGDIGAPTEGGGTPTPPTGPDASGRPVARRDPGGTRPGGRRVPLRPRRLCRGRRVTGGGNIPEERPRYRKVTTATELVAALQDAKASSANPVKVIEILNDLNMGFNEVGTLLTSQTSNPLRANLPATKHPALIASGVTLLDIQDFSGLTIYSKNGVDHPPRRVQHQERHEPHPAQPEVRRAVGVGRGHARRLRLRTTGTSSRLVMAAE